MLESQNGTASSILPYLPCNRLSFATTYQGTREFASAAESVWSIRCREDIRCSICSVPISILTQSSRIKRTGLRHWIAAESGHQKSGVWRHSRVKLKCPCGSCGRYAALRLDKGKVCGAECSIARATDGLRRDSFGYDPIPVSM